VEQAIGAVAAAPGQDFVPPAWMANPHVQSLLASAPLRRPLVVRRALGLIRSSRSVLLDGVEGSVLHGWYTRPEGRASRGLAVLIHGWEGSGNSLYLLSAATRLHAAGWSVLRLHLRDHGPTHHLNPGMFHSNRIEEVTAAVAHAASLLPERPVCLGGFSLGGNFALRVATRAPEAGIPLARVMAVCPVLDPHSTLVAMEQGPAIYEAYFMRKWRQSLAIKAARFPELYRFGDLRRFRGLRDMTAFFVAGYTDYGDLDEYLAGYAVTGDTLAALSVPTWLLSSEDDPVIPARDLARVARPPDLSVQTTARGGHCGFLFSPFGHSWIDACMAGYFEGAR
jgi:predicted alpha/beta-fold hydrolase